MVNGDWLSHVLGVLGVLGEMDSWQGDDAQRDAAIQQVERLLADFAEGCAMLLLRQNPENFCQLEQSIDGGDTWTLAFDYSLCDSVNPLEEMVIELEYKNWSDAINIQYDGTVESVEPDLLYDDTEDDRYRDMALCNTINIFVRAVVEIELERRNGVFDTGWGIFEILTDIVFRMALRGGISAQVFLLGAVVKLIAKVMWEFLRSVAIEVLLDETAILDVICCMYATMLNQTPSQAIYEASLDDCGYDPETNSEYLREAISKILTDKEVYLAFLGGMADGLDLAKLGVGLDCGCATWSYLWLSGNGRPPYDNVIEGVYRSGADDYYKDHVVNEPPSTIRVEVEITPPEPILSTKVQWTGNIISSVTGTRMQFLELKIAGSWWIADSTDEGTGAFTLTWQGDEIVEAVRMTCRSASAGAPPRNARVVGLTIEGEGYDPFEGM